MNDPSKLLRPMPPVEQLRPGLWSVPVPIPNSSLAYVFVYVFETPRGIYLFDVGWNTDEAYEALTSGLAQAGFAITDVKGVMVTHLHPDHYGLAGRVREASGGWVGLHPADAKLIHDRYEEPDGLLGRMGEMLRRMGAPDDEREALQNASMQVRPFVDAVHPDVLVEDGDRLDVPGWEIDAIWTPGHSPGHLCFWEGTRNLFLSGDHVLPRITPNVPFHPQAGANPLQDFLDSLEKISKYQADEVLPAHEHRFVGLSARVAQLVAHHDLRFGEVIEAIREGATTAWDIAARMHWSRSWDSIQGFMRRAAVGEALSHIRVLEIKGLVKETVGEPSRFELLPAAL